MGRKSKDARSLNVHIDRKVFEQFESFCQDLGQTKTIATERALKMYMAAGGSIEKGAKEDGQETV